MVSTSVWILLSALCTARANGLNSLTDSEAAGDDEKCDFQLVEKPEPNKFEMFIGHQFPKSLIGLRAS